MHLRGGANLVVSTPLASEPQCSKPLLQNCFRRSRRSDALMSMCLCSLISWKIQGLIKAPLYGVKETDCKAVHQSLFRLMAAQLLAGLCRYHTTCAMCILMLDWLEPHDKANYILTAQQDFGGKLLCGVQRNRLSTPEDSKRGSYRAIMAVATGLSALMWA